MFEVKEMFVLKNPDKFKLSRVVICDTTEGFSLFVAGIGCFYQGEDYRSFREAEMDLIDIFLKKRLKIKEFKLKWVSFKPGDEVDQEEKRRTKP
jgi:hypothetical protein